MCFYHCFMLGDFFLFVYFFFIILFLKFYLPGGIPNCQPEINIPNWGSFQATAQPSLQLGELCSFCVFNKSSYFPSFQKDSN